MNTTIVLLIFLVSLLIAFVVFMSLLQSRTMKFLDRMMQEQRQTTTVQMDQTNQLLQKSLSLLGTKDPLSYQAVAAMDQQNQSSMFESVPLTDAEELAQWEAQHPGEQVPEGDIEYDSLDRDALADLNTNSGRIPIY